MEQSPREANSSPDSQEIQRILWNWRVQITKFIIQGDRKVTQPIQTYLLIVAVQYNLNG
jgi:hypothetical protein